VNTRSALALALPAACLLAGCGKTYRPADGAAPPLAIHPVVAKGTFGSVAFLADGIPQADDAIAYYLPDPQLTGVRVESVSVEPTNATNHVHVRLAPAERDKIRAFAADHPETEYFGIRFESTPAGPEPGGGVGRGGVIVQVFKETDLTDDGRLRFTRSTSAEAEALAKRLVGR
jgi:hypothetical protein